MMDEQELANSLFGASRIETTEPHTMSTIQGVAVADSVDGTVKVKINGESIAEDADATEPNTVVELPTTPAVKEGDTVTITCEGGVLKTMTVTGNNGSGDYGEQLTDEASKVAKNFIQLTDDNNIIIGNLSDEVAQNDAGDTNIIFECTGSVSQNDVAFSKDGHVHANLFVVKEVTIDYTIDPSSYKQYAVPYPTVKGYAPFAVASLNAGWTTCFISSYSFNTKTGYFSADIFNAGTLTLSKTATFNLVYIANGWTEEAE